MRTALIATLALLSTTAQADTPTQQATVGQPAPAFTLTDLAGKSVSLSDYAGKPVVLEWFNPECPYVVYAHDEGPLGAMPTAAADKGVVWLAINSGAPGKQGTTNEVNEASVARWHLPNGVLLDPTGTVGRTYGATNTPEMFIVNAEGTLVYNGAVDNAPLGKVQGGGQELWLDDALTDVLNNAEVRRANNKPYGCSVKYGS